MRKALALFCFICVFCAFLFSCMPQNIEEPPPIDPPGNGEGGQPSFPPGGTEGDPLPEGIYVGMYVWDFIEQLPKNADVSSLGDHWCFINENGKLVIVRTSPEIADSDLPYVVEEIVVCDPPTLQSRSDLQDRVQVGMTLVELIKELGIPTTEKVNGQRYIVFPLADEKKLITNFEWMGYPNLYVGLKEFWFEYPPAVERPGTTIQY